MGHPKDRFKLEPRWHWIILIGWGRPMSAPSRRQKTAFPRKDYSLPARESQGIGRRDGLNLE